MSHTIVEYNILVDSPPATVIVSAMMLLFAFGAGAWAIGYSVRRLYTGRGLLWQPLFFALISVVMCVFSGSFLQMSYRPWQDVMARHRSGMSRVIEGRVKVLEMQNSGGHSPPDLIKISGQNIRVDRSGLGYIKTIAHGGALREGALVRVWMVNDVIARVELLEE